MDPKKNKRRAVVVRTRGLSPRAVATENSGRFQNQQDTVRPCNVDEFLVDGLFADHRSRARGRTPEQDGRSQASAKPKRRGALRLTSWLESRRSTCCSSHNCFAKLRHAPQLPKAFSSQVDNVRVARDPPSVEAQQRRHSFQFRQADLNEVAYGHG